MAYLDSQDSNKVVNQSTYEEGGATKDERYRMVRHGFGLQIFNGNRNSDGILTKYEGSWALGFRSGLGCAVFTDGSTYEGEFSMD